MPTSLDPKRDAQEHLMRWIVFATLQIVAIASIAAVLVYGPSVWTAGLAIPSLALSWLVRQLFRRDDRT